MKDETRVVQVLEDRQNARIDDKLRATLDFLEKVTLSPDRLGPADIAPLRAAGVSDRAIEEALYVTFLFNLMDRLADAFDFTLPSAEDTQKNARLLYRLGYRAASVPG